MDTNGNPISSVRLILKGIRTKSSSTTLSNINGFFEFTDLDEGTYMILAKKKGYKRSKQKIKLKNDETKTGVKIELKRGVFRNIKIDLFSIGTAVFYFAVPVCLSRLGKTKRKPNNNQLN